MSKLIARRQQREWAVQVLYLMEQTDNDLEQAWEYFLYLEPSAAEAHYTRHLLWGIWEKKEKLDEKIKKTLSRWRLERLSRVDLIIVRMGLFEIEYCADVPPAVAVDEAIELGKAFGGEDSGRFINGILGRFFEEQE